MKGIKDVTDALEDGGIMDDMTDVENMVGLVPTEDVGGLVSAGGEVIGMAGLLESTTGVSNIGVLADLMSTASAVTGTSPVSGFTTGTDGMAFTETGVPAVTTTVQDDSLYTDGTMAMPTPSSVSTGMGNWNGSMTSSWRMQNSSSPTPPSSNNSRPANVSTSTKQSTGLPPPSTALFAMSVIPSKGANNSTALSASTPQSTLKPGPYAMPQNGTNSIPQNGTHPIPQNGTVNGTSPRPAYSTNLMNPGLASSTCPAPVTETFTEIQTETETCTTTETWHSTVYSDTVTLYSFMDVMTVTCTVTSTLR
jgi:hypothetical protein